MKIQIDDDIYSITIDNTKYTRITRYGSVSNHYSNYTCEEIYKLYNRKKSFLLRKEKIERILK